MHIQQRITNHSLVGTKNQTRLQLRSASWSILSSFSSLFWLYDLQLNSFASVCASTPALNGQGQQGLVSIVLPGKHSAAFSCSRIIQLISGMSCGDQKQSLKERELGYVLTLSRWTEIRLQMNAEVSSKFYRMLAGSKSISPKTT